MDINDSFNEEELFALGELGIEPKSLIFNHHTLNMPFLKERRYVCHLQIKDGLYSFNIPDKLPRQFKKSIVKTERKLLQSNNAHMRRLMTTAKRNAEFIARFNSELFYKNAFYEGKKMTANELIAFYETPPFCHIIDLSATADCLHFAALYAMTFYAQAPEDLFTVEGVFTLQPERHSDNAKKTAGNSVFNLILRNDKTEIERVLVQMGKALSDIQPPRVNLSDTVMLIKNYTLFIGLSEIGRVFARNAPNNQLREEAQSLMNYGALAKLCETIAASGNDEDYRDSDVFKECTRLF
ncbi:MAG: hypothetical protein FWF94_06025 [Oscillospiraceae bacterium]|nr:hypothetical protein [Oscillospiraceae bacterium]